MRCGTSNDLSTLTEEQEPSLSSTVAEDYSRRRALLTTELESQQAALAQSWTYLLFAVAATALTAYYGILHHALPNWSPILPLAAIVPLARRIYAANTANSTTLRRLAFYDAAQARLDGTWPGTGNPGDHVATANHLYAADLDLFGPGGLFELLCMARTGSGQVTLARWLQTPAPISEVLDRQQAVAELAPLLELRELWSATGRAPETNSLPQWLNTPPIALPPIVRAAAFIVPIAAITLAISATRIDFRALLQPAAWLASAGALLFLPIRSRVQASHQAFALPAYELELLQPLLALFEHQTFHSPLLVRLQTALHPSAAQKARRLSALAKVPGYLRNEYLAVVSTVFFAGTHLAFFIETWRRDHALPILTALAAIGEFEALLSLATYAAENPADPFPELLPNGPLFQADGLGHPLLPATANIRNSVTLHPARQLLIVSGSNMSGKSTLLRSIGLNAILAWAGAPVRATRLAVSNVTVAASIGVSDTLRDGKSRFYAEVERLRAVMTLAETTPVLFLLDEILSGTNSQDRLAGAEAIVTALLQSGAIGLITTHDLALTRIAPAQAENVHFQEQFEEDRMTFDYRMRPGILPHTNGTALMRTLGIVFPEK